MALQNNNIEWFQQNKRMAVYTRLFAGFHVSWNRYGGHCNPVDPFYLAWKAKDYHFNLQFIELAHQINQKIP